MCARVERSDTLIGEREGSGELTTIEHVFSLVNEMESLSLEVTDVHCHLVRRVMGGDDVLHGQTTLGLTQVGLCGAHITHVILMLSLQFS